MNQPKSLHHCFSESLAEPSMDVLSLDKGAPRVLQLHGNLLGGNLLKIFGLNPYRLVFLPGPSLMKMYK